MRAARLLLVLGVAVVAAAPVACGGATPAEAVAGAGPALREAGTARLDLLFTFDLAAPAQSLTMRGDGTMDYERRRSAASFELPGGVVEVIGSGRDVYLRAPRNPLVPDHAGWLLIEASAAIDNAEEALGVVSGTDPGKLLENMRAAGDVTEVGREPVRGVETTHYRAELDPERAADQLTFLQREQLDLLQRQGTTVTLTAEVWLDGDGRPRRLRSVSAVEGVVTATFTIEFFDLGARINISVPSESEIGATRVARSTADLFDIGQQVGAAVG